MPAELKYSEAFEAAEQVINIESVMQSHSGSYPTSMISSSSHELLKPVLTQAFISQPILGNIILSEEQRTKIHTMAEDTLSVALKRTYLKDYGISDFYCDILMLETVLLLRNWSDRDIGDDVSDDDMNFWEYICNQYALSYDESFGNSHAYRIFRQVIKRSLQRHNRLFVKVGQKYYTTMLIHALAPKIKFYDLLEQIFAFYAKTLNYQYINNDPAFQAFSQAMKSRFESEHSRVDDDVYIKSLQSSSAIRALFLYCPEYMGSFVENIVRSIDVLLATGKIRESSYIDTLLLGWYKNRSRAERSLAKRKRSIAGLERVVTEFSYIRPSYRCDAEKLSLVIPSIRLGKASENPPYITIYRNSDDSNPYYRNLKFYGDYFCITSLKITIPIDKLLFDNPERIELRVIISHSNKDIYDSGTKLYRDAIVFGDDGGEVSKRPDKEYVNIFVAGSGHVEGEDTLLDYAISRCGNGYLYRALIGDQTHFIINGTDLFPVEQVISGLTLNMSIAPVSYCKYLIDQKECAIFTKQTTLRISFADKTFEKKYRLMIDDRLYSLAEYITGDVGYCSIVLPKEYGVHEVRIIENATQLRVYAFNYIVFEKFSLHFNGFYYFANYISNGFVEISNIDGVNCHEYEIASTSNKMFLPYKDGDLAIDIPILYWHLNGDAIPFDMEQAVWYEDIPMSALLELDVPRGFSCTVLIGRKTFMSDKIEIGNEIRARNYSPIETVSLELRQGNEDLLKIKLFDIVFKPLFKSQPLLMEKNTLLWCVEDNYIGAADSEFEVCIYCGQKEIRRYVLGCTDEIMPIERPLEDGLYDYIVFKKPSGLFGDLDEIVAEQFIIGDPALFRFDNLAVIVTEAIIDNERVQLSQDSSIITGLKYLGELALNGESLHYPCYEGLLQYIYKGRLRPYADKEYELNGIFREQVNPIKLWIINAYTISLRTPWNDGLYVNKRWKSITDRTPSRGSGDEGNYCNPDYYAFKIITQTEV